MWLNELDILKEQSVEYKEERVRLMSGVAKKKVVSKNSVKKIVKKQNLMVEVLETGRLLVDSHLREYTLIICHQIRLLQQIRTHLD